MNLTTVSFKTVGCRLNQAETAQMRAAFESAGYTVVPFGQTCHVCVIHGCTVTAKAEKDSIRLARSMKHHYPQTFVILAGCVSEIEGEPIRQTSGADLIAGQKEKVVLPALLTRYGFHPAPQPATFPPRFDTTRAIVKIQDGCDFQCAYCIVPNARGHSRSRPAAEIIKEITRLVESGYREVVLTGANIGSYEDNGKTLADLLEQVEAMTPVERIRLSSIEISTVERPVIDFMASSKKLCRFLHLPLQSGDDSILAAMGRRYTMRQFRDVIEYAMQKVGLIGFGTDVLVGFPGEDSESFAATERLIKDLPFSNLHVFAFSKRKGTRAANMSGQVAESEKRGRVARLIELGHRKRVAFARQWVAREACVLIESLDAAGQGKGWTGEYLPARVQGPHLHRNQLIRFVPKAVDGDVLVGNFYFSH